MARCPGELLMSNEPPANFKDRQRWYKSQSKATAFLYPHKKKKKKQKNPRRNKSYLPPVCFSFFEHNDAARKYARKYRGLTPAEWQVWSRLVHDPNHKWHRQVPCGSYILDFYCHETRTVVEIDGPEHYTPQGIKHDNQRTGFLRHKYGLRVLRYKNDDVYLDGDAVVADIMNQNSGNLNHTRSPNLPTSAFHLHRPTHHEAQGNNPMKHKSPRRKPIKSMTIYFHGANIEQALPVAEAVKLMSDELIDGGQYSAQTVMDMRDAIRALLKGR
jgi:very-short-patch-repair endonuclease